MTERWLPVPGYEGRYIVSDRGRVAGLRHSAPWILRHYPSGGRPQVTLSRSREDTQKFGVGTLVLLAFVGPRPDGMQCCHENDDPWDNRLENLRWDTQRANSADALRNGGTPIGEACHGARLCEADVRLIRESYAAGEKSPSIAARFGVSARTVRDAATGRTWAHIPGACSAPEVPRKPPRYRTPDPRRRLFAWQGETLRMSVLARRHGLSAGTLSRRLNSLGWDLARALTEPVDARRHQKAGRS